jgi:hypothetical protein
MAQHPAAERRGVSQFVGLPVIPGFGSGTPR